MARLYEYAFQPVSGNAPSFNSSMGALAVVYALESTQTREWQFPSNRTVRASNNAGDACHLLFCPSSTGVATVTGCPLVLGNSAEVFRVDPSHKWVSVVGSSTDVSVNFTLGHGF